MTISNTELPALETLKLLAVRAGLSLTDEELEQMRAGAARNTAMGAVVRTWLSDTLEPAPIFTAASPTA
jgi:hypothetical protein